MKTLNFFLIGMVSIMVAGVILPNVFSESVQSTVKSNEVETLPYNGTQFDLKINETYVAESGAFKIKLLNITSDSRCPATVYCIWQGQVTVLVGMTLGNQYVGNSSLSTLSGHDQLVSGKYSLLLVQVKPSVLAGTKISASDYVITFVMSNADIRSPLVQFKSGVAAENIQCKANLDLVFKAEDGSPACVKSDTVQMLIERGWAVERLLHPE